MKIAISGKGGAGKTTISASLTRLFEENGHSVYAVDADPDASLGMALGFEDADISRLPPIVDLKEIIEERAGGKGGIFSLNPKVDDVIERFSLQSGRVRLLKMGSIKKAATACYCPENSFLKAVVRALALEKDDVVVLDMCAGIEHLTRGTAQGVDRMLIVTEPTAISLKTAKVAAGLAKDLGVGSVSLVGNKVRDKDDESLIEREAGGFDVVGFLPYEPDMFGATLRKAGSGEPFWTAMRSIYAGLFKPGS